MMVLLIWPYSTWIFSFRKHPAFELHRCISSVLIIIHLYVGVFFISNSWCYFSHQLEGTHFNYTPPPASALQAAGVFPAFQRQRHKWEFPLNRVLLQPTAQKASISAALGGLLILSKKFGTAWSKPLKKQLISSRVPLSRIIGGTRKQQL